MFDTAYAEALGKMNEVKVPHKLSFDAAVDRFLDSQKFKAYAPSSAKSTTRRLRHLAKDYGNHSIRELTPVKLRNLLDKIESTGERNRTLSMFRLVLEESKDKDIIPSNPANRVKRVKHVTKSYAVWTREDIDAYLKHWPRGTVQHLSMQLLYRTGQRSSDVVRLGPHNLRNGRIELKQGKTKTYVSIPLHTELKKVLPKHNHNTWILNRHSKPYSAKGFQQQFVKWARAAGIEGKSSHGVRAAVATHAAEAGATAHEIMSVTGHKALSEVERYTRSANRAALADSMFEKGKESNGD